MKKRDNAVAGLTEISAAWQGRQRSAIRRAVFGGFLSTSVVTILVGRQGTATMRLAAVGLLGAFVAFVVGKWSWQRRRSKTPMLEVTAIVEKLDRPLATRLKRAIELVKRAQLHAPRVSVELADLHLQRIVARVPRLAIEDLLATRAARLGLLSTLVILTSLGIVLLAPVMVFEGIDVLLARGNVAPLPMRLVELEPVTIQPPAYLRGSSNSVEFDTSTAEPQGSLIVVHGTPRRAGRALVLTDGIREVPFVSDGQGGITASYLLERSVRLRVAVRFGSVLLHQMSALSLEAITDLAPAVELEGAPKRVSIGDVSEIEFRYRIIDDHGIRQVDLVLRAGSREERRSLLRLDGNTSQHVGAYVLDAADAFVTSSYGSVDAFVAARDDNTLDSASWGQSAVITIDKPSLGQAQVRRRDAYESVRNQLVDLLAAIQTEPKSNSDLKSLKSRTLAVLSDAETGIAHDASVRRIMRSFLRAQRDKLLRAERDSARLAAVLEEVTLAVDSTIEAVGLRDAEHVARLLGDVAVEIESGAKAALLGERRDQGTARVKSAHMTLAAGAAELKHLGVLGADLGEIAQAGWFRIGHSLQAGDLVNVQRAASFLAERLRRPQPSFVGGSRAGVESQRSYSGRAKGPKASEADVHIERVAAELLQLAREHASEIESVERIVGDSDGGLGSDDMRPATKQHADDLRRIVDGLPPLGAEPGSMRASLALAKELVRGAAESLERLQLAGAYAGLQKADAALLEAVLLREPLALGHTDLGPEAVREMRTRLAAHRDWVKKMLDETRESGMTKSRDMLRRAAPREREIAERANRLAHRESKNDAVLPEDSRSDLEQASRLMRQAAEMLDSGRGRVALEQQRQAQSLLERNEPEPEKTGSESSPSSGKDDRNTTIRETSRGGSVVSTGDAESRETFRRRVQKGLSREVSPELSPAIRRYAEGLLK